MIQMVVENAHKAGIWAGICGELGADQELTKEFLAMGVDELSVSREASFRSARSFWKQTWQNIRQERNVNTAET